MAKTNQQEGDPPKGAPVGEAPEVPPVPEFVPPWRAPAGRQVWNADKGRYEDAPAAE